MSKQSINWGMLSTARINRQLVGPIKDYAKSNLYAVASRDEDKAKTYAAQNGFEKYYGNYQQLVDDPNVDAVYISLPNGMHHEWIKKCLEQGKHVLCEKAITTTLDDLLEIKELSEKYNLFVMEGFMYRYHPYFQKVFEICTSDMIGSIKNIQVSRCAPQKNPNDIRLIPGLGPGAMGDIGCYCLNYCRSLYQKEPVEWKAFVKDNHNQVDIETTATLIFGPQQTAQFYCSFTSTGSFASIIGDNGRLTFMEPFQVRTGNMDITYISNDHKQEIISVHAEKTGHALEVIDFTNAIIENRNPYLSIDDSVGNIKIMQDIVENAPRI